MKEIGTVISVKGNSVVVEVQKKAVCRSCGRCGGHISFSRDSIIIEAVKTGNPGPGDLVELEIPDSDYLRLSLLVYALPLVCAGAGYGGGWLLGRLLGNPSTWGWFFALGCFALCFVWLRNYDIATTQARKYMPIARPVQEE